MDGQVYERQNRGINTKQNNMDGETEGLYYLVVIWRESKE